MAHKVKRKQSSGDATFLSFNVLKCMKNNGELTDVVIQCGNQSISAHRAILAAAFPLFRRLFAGCDTEAGEENGTAVKCVESSEDGKITVKRALNEESEIVITEGIDAAILNSLIDSAYINKIKITADNAESLLEVSAFFGSSSVKSLCSGFLAKHLDSNNVMRIQNLADSLHRPRLSKACGTWIRDNFTVAFESEEFVNLQFSTLDEITGDSDLIVRSEEQVFEAVIKWVKSSPSDRHPHLHRLLRNVRMPLLAPEYLFERVSAEELIKTSLPCRRLVDEAEKYLVHPERRSLFRSFSNEPRNCKIPRGQHGLYVICHKKHLGPFVNYYDTSTKRWEKMVTDSTCKEPNPADNFGDCFVSEEGRITITGSWFPWELNLQTLQWSLVTSMLQKYPAYCSIAPTEHKIYCFGGVNSNRVCCFDIQQNKWYEVMSMRSTRYCTGVVASDQYIYVTGGICENEACATVERCHPDSKTWITLAPMLCKRQNHGCATLNGKIYACGGYNGRTLNSAEVYDPLTNQWCAVSSMKDERSSFSLLAHNGELYAFDGVSKTGPVCGHNVEIYSPDKDVWKPGRTISCYHESATAVRAVMVPPSCLGSTEMWYNVTVVMLEKLFT